MPLPTQSRWPLVWDTLFGQLQSESLTGGRIAGVKTVTHTQYPSMSNVFPAVGVQLVKATWEVIGQRRRRERAQFAVVLFTLAAPTDSAADPIENAIVALRPLVNDGQGNGLEPILNSAGVYLAPFSVQTVLTDIEYDILPNPDQQSQAVAYARCMLEVIDQVSSAG